LRHLWRPPRTGGLLIAGSRLSLLNTCS